MDKPWTDWTDEEFDAIEEQWAELSACLEGDGKALQTLVERWSALGEGRPFPTRWSQEQAMGEKNRVAEALARCGGSLRAAQEQLASLEAALQELPPLLRDGDIPQKTRTLAAQKQRLADKLEQRETASQVVISKLEGQLSTLGTVLRQEEEDARLKKEELRRAMEESGFTDRETYQAALSQLPLRDTLRRQVEEHKALLTSVEAGAGKGAGGERAASAAPAGGPGGGPAPGGGGKTTAAFRSHLLPGPLPAQLGGAENSQPGQPKAGQKGGHHHRIGPPGRRGQRKPDEL